MRSQSLPVVKLPFLEFFAGAGLARMALEPEWDCLWANDFDPKKAASYRENFSPDNLLLGDVRQVKGSQLPTGALMAWASFPCQDLSLAGKGSGIKAERSSTFFDFKRILEELASQRPPLVVIENVPGLLSGDNFAILCEHIASLDYNFGALVMDARFFVPQSRARVFVVALDSKYRPDDFSSPLIPDSPWLPSNLMKAWAKLSEAVQDRWIWWDCPAPPSLRVTLDSLIEDRPSSVSWHAPEKTEYIISLMDSANLAKLNKAKASRSKQYGFIYRRTRKGVQRAEVRFDGIAGCLRTPSGGSSRQTLICVKGNAIRTRLISSREAARFMGVSDAYKLVGSYNDVYKAMGDGVAVPVVNWLSQNLLLPIARQCAEQRKAFLSDKQVCSA